MFLKAIPMGQTAESRPSAYTFANMVQTNDLAASGEVPDELKTIGRHLWLANVEASAKRF